VFVCVCEEFTNALQKIKIILCLVISGIIQFAIGKQAFSQAVENILASVEDPQLNRYDANTLV